MSARDAIGVGVPSTVAITVDGADVDAYDGETVAATLTRTGRVAWRTTRGAGAPRGLFCGIGICHDCLVTVNGVASIRACLEPIRAGDVIVTSEADPAPNGEGHR